MAVLVCYERNMQRELKMTHQYHVILDIIYFCNEKHQQIPDLLTMRINVLLLTVPP